MNEPKIEVRKRPKILITIGKNLSFLIRLSICFSSNFYCNYFARNPWRKRVDTIVSDDDMETFSSEVGSPRPHQDTIEPGATEQVVLDQNDVTNENGNALFDHDYSSASR